MSHYAKKIPDTVYNENETHEHDETSSPLY